MTNLDDWIIPFGKHRGKRLDVIDASYLLWLADQEFAPVEVKKYVKKYEKYLKKEQNGEDPD